MLTPSIIQTNGEYVIWQRSYQVKNNAPSTYVLDLNIPAGAIFVANLSGANTTYDALPTPRITFTGVDGRAPNGTVITIVLQFQIPVVGNTPYTFQIDRLSGPDTVLTNNLGVDVLNVEFCPPEGGAASDPFSCGCGNVSENDTPCSSCTSEWRYNNDIVNGTMNFWDPATGKYHVTPINPYLPVTFTYNLWCINCQDGNNYDVSGPATVTIPALWSGSPVPVFKVEQFQVLPGFPIQITLGFIPAPGYALAVFTGSAHNFDYVVVGNQIQFLNPLTLGVNENGPFIDIAVHYFA